MLSQATSCKPNNQAVKPFCTTSFKVETKPPATNADVRRMASVCVTVNCLCPQNGRKVYAARRDSREAHGWAKLVCGVRQWELFNIKENDPG